MPAAFHLIDDLLDPISTDQPAGSDLRWTPEWDQIKEARRADDNLQQGKWEKRERKAANWLLTKELITTTLRERSKDLQLALWLTEANLKLHGFPGLRDGLRVTRELMVRYWDKGLYPVMEDGPEDRAGPFEWLSNKLVDAITAVPITARSDGGPDYSFIHYQDALRVGTVANCKDTYDEIDPVKKKAYDKALAEGHLSMEMFDLAIKESKPEDYEKLHSDFQETYEEFIALDKVVTEKFGDTAPNLSACTTSLSEMRQLISDIWAKKRPIVLVQSADPAQHSGGADQLVIRFPISLLNMQGSQSTLAGSWQEAETLIRSGQVEKGLAEMTRLAASETNGRNRFQRKLLLAEICLASKRDRLARSILEELAEQIDKFQLEHWESSEVIGTIWTRLYRIYKSGGDSSDSGRADKLYERLCRLDPWQALNCTEG